MFAEAGSHCPEQKEHEVKSFDVVVVAPGFEANEHRTGLHWDTRFRLLAASEFFQSGRTRKIVVGGARIRQMDESFADLMKNELVRRGIPEAAIETEEFTYDTASQIEWIERNRELYGQSMGFITDPEQAKHVNALLRGFGLSDQINIFTTEEIISQMANSRHYRAFFERLHDSPYWQHWKLREKVLELFTHYFDPKGEKMRRLTSDRKQL